MRIAILAGAFWALLLGALALIPATAGTNDAPTYPLNDRADLDLKIADAEANWGLSAAAAAEVRAAFDAQEAPVVGTGEITGTVSGAVQADVLITLTGQQTGSVTTAGDGSYGFTALDPGAYTVTPSKAGFTFAPASRNFTVNQDSHIANFVATALPPGTPLDAPGLAGWAQALDDGSNMVMGGSGGWRILSLTGLDNTIFTGNVALPESSTIRIPGRKDGFDMAVDASSVPTPYTTSKICIMSYKDEGGNKGGPQYGNVYTFPQIDGSGDFSLWLVFMNTRTGWRTLWGANNNVELRFEAGGSGKIKFYPGDGSDINIAQGLPRGFTILEITRENGLWKVFGNGGQDYSTGVTDATAFHVNRFGWNGAGSDHFHDWALAFCMVEGPLTAALRTASFRGYFETVFADEG